MRDFLTADDLYSQLVLLQAVDPRVVMLVEGESDSLILDQYIDEMSCQSVPGYGKKTVLGAMEIVDRQSKFDVLAVVDLDLTDLTEARSDSRNVVYTDYYDLDAHLVYSENACKRILANFCDGEAVSEHLSQVGCTSAAQLATRLAFPLGILRMISIRDGLSLSLRKFPLSAVIDLTDGIVSVSSMVAIAIARSGNSSAQPDQVEQLVTTEIATYSVEERFCSGHDLLAALAHVMSKKWGCASVSSDTLQRLFRLAFRRRDLRSSGLWRAVVDWQERNGRKIWRRA